MIPVLFTYWEPLESSGEINNGLSETEQVYIDHNEQIESFIAAGERLNAARAELYEFGPDEEVPDGYMDPTRVSGFDFSDVTAAEAGIRARKAQADKAAADKEAEEAAAAEELKEPLVEKNGSA